MLGPNLANLKIKPNDESIVESLLSPSKFIHEQYRTVSVLTESGTAYRGVIASQDENQVSLVDATNPQQTIEIPKNDIEQIVVSDVSRCPPDRSINCRARTV